MNTIPKKIHWCWLSGEPLPKLVQQCINSWKRVMPDYEITLWDQSRFDIHSVKFVEDACKARKWAFAADYIRLYALYHEGGIYLDSDVKVFRRFDTLLNHAAFSAVEYYPAMKSLRTGKDDQYWGYDIQAAIIGSEKGNDFIKICLDHYREKEFKMTSNGDIDVDLVPIVMARIAHQYYGFQYDLPLDTTQYLKNDIVIFPPRVLSVLFGKADMNTYAIHLGQFSWLPKIKQPTGLHKFHRNLCGNYLFFAMIHWKRKNLQRRITRLVRGYASHRLF
ncbi:MAG: polysaccharide biosynthesis protein [Dysgonamonadaceae bacterium]|jgi:hypothetical protein|nr:polysaccharide biosynthesis protein [Dysgonamonadaceae bacterium]